MKSLVFAANKGGVGKTTLSALFSIKAAKLYKKAYLIDLDPQKSLHGWWQKREEDQIELIDANYTDLSKVLLKVQDEDGLLIIDTPPAHINIIETAIKVADYVLIPCRPSPIDIEAIGETITLVEEMKKPFSFILNSSISGTQISEQAIALLSRYGQIAPALVRQRVVYATSMIDGRTAIEMSNKQANIEIDALWNFFSKEIGG